MSHERPTFTPADLAGYDQAAATICTAVEGLINTHRQAMTLGGMRREVAVASMAMVMCDEMDTDTLAYCLAFAVDRLTGDGQ